MVVIACETNQRFNCSYIIVSRKSENHSVSHKWIGMSDVPEKMWNRRTFATMPQSISRTVQHVNVRIIKKTGQDIYTFLKERLIGPSQLGEYLGPSGPVPAVIAETIFFP